MSIAIDPKVIDLAGKSFGRWEAIEYVGNRYWRCRCECGVEKDVPSHYLRRGKSRSCGCLQRELCGDRARTHGKKNTPEWKAWSSMRKRCLNPNNASYRHYGGRGIIVCERWRDSFEAFWEDMGPRPEGCSLDRIDNDGNYEPSNCRWATRIDQQRNKSTNRLVEWRGRKLTVVELAEEVGISLGALRDRLYYGWSLERAINTPVRIRKEKVEA